MKILFAIKSLNGPGGGAEKVLVDVVNGLHRRGHDVQVLTFDYPGEAFYDLSPLIERLDMAFNRGGESMPRRGLLKALPRIRAAIAAEQPDVIVAFMHSTYVPVAIAALGLGLPLVVSEHTEARHYETRPLQRLVRQVVDRWAAIRTVPSEAVRLGYDDVSSTSAMVVPNPVALTQYSAFLGVAPVMPPVVLSIGRLTEEKGHSVLLDAFARVANDFPEWRLRILGDGPLRDSLEAQLVELGLIDRVNMPGFTREVGEAYASATFLVLPSRYESFGMVASEALATGRPVLSFDDCAGISEIVKSGTNGLLVRGKPERAARVVALAHGLRQMMSDPDLCARLGKMGPESVAQYGLDNVLDRWEEVLSKAVPKMPRKNGDRKESGQI
tara:strand:- start:9735 stop:10889 length:1155 start_codon:yes stop_codon:yes gene_type:complete